MQRTAGAGRLRVMAVLEAIFNFFALNLALVIACLPILTAPAACQAAVVALDRWREDGEDRVVREFIAALRSRPLAHATLSAGVPFAAVAAAVVEVRFFSSGGAAANSLCLGLGVAGAVLSLAGLGYALVLGASGPELPATDLWYLAILLSVRNWLSASPLLVAELAAGVLLLHADPSLAVIGLPLAVLSLVRVTAERGIRRGERQRLSSTRRASPR